MLGHCVLGTTIGHDVVGWGALSSPSDMLSAALDIHELDSNDAGKLIWSALRGFVGHQRAWLLVKYQPVRDGRNRRGFWGVGGVFLDEWLQNSVSDCIAELEALFSIVEDAAIEDGHLDMQRAQDTVADRFRYDQEDPPFVFQSAGELAVVAIDPQWKNRSNEAWRVFAAFFGDKRIVNAFAGFQLTDRRVQRADAEIGADLSLLLGDIYAPLTAMIERLNQRIDVLSEEKAKLAAELRARPLAIAPPRPIERTPPRVQESSVFRNPDDDVPRRRDERDREEREERRSSDDGGWGHSQDAVPTTKPDVAPPSPANDTQPKGGGIETIPPLALAAVIGMVVVLALLFIVPRVIDRSGRANEAEQTQADAPNYEDPQSLRAYLLSNPRDERAVEIYRNLDLASYRRAEADGSRAAFERYLRDFDVGGRLSGLHVRAANERLDEIRQADVQSERFDVTADIHLKLFALGFAEREVDSPERTGVALVSFLRATRCDAGRLDGPIEALEEAQLDRIAGCVDDAEAAGQRADGLEDIAASLLSAGQLDDPTKDLLTLQRAWLAANPRNRPVNWLDAGAVRRAADAAETLERVALVRQIQQSLKDMGILSPDTVVDGAVGRGTRAAWAQFVERARLPNDLEHIDIIDIETLRRQAERAQQVGRTEVIRSR